MTEQEKIKEVKKLLAFIYLEWRKEITPELVSFWKNMLRGIDRKLAWQAARKLAETKTFGEPKFQDFAEVLKEIQPRPERPYSPWVTPTDSDPIREIIRIVSDRNDRKYLN